MLATTGTLDDDYLPLSTSAGDRRGAPREQENIEGNGYMHVVDLFSFEVYEKAGHERNMAIWDVNGYGFGGSELSCTWQ